MSSINPGTINSAAKGNEALRVLLNAVSAQLSALSLGTGVQLLEPTSGGQPQTPNVAPPAQATLTVTGANGVFTFAITNPAQTIGGTIYHEVSYSASSNFSGAVALPLTPAAGFTFAAPGQTLFWRIRSSYDRAHFNAYRPAAGNAAINAGLQSSAATANNVALNHSNYAYVDSVADGAAASVRVYGAGGPGTAWIGVKGTVQTKYPSATITNVPYLSELFVAWDGAQYRLLPNLPGVFPDTWVMVGKVSVVGSGSVVLPTITATVSGGQITGYTVTSPGNGLSDPVTITITDATGHGATAGAQTLSGGHLTAVAPGLPGSGYSATPTVTASGGTFAGTGGGGTASGGNGGRCTAV